MADNTIPRRARMDQWTPAEHAIRAAMLAVEEAGADERLTKAVILLGDAQAWVADHVDGVKPEDHFPRPAGLRTDAELGELKGNWLHDPCWDIEETEGFEAHRHELTAFRLRHELTAHQSIQEKAEALGLTMRGFALFRDLEGRIEKLEEAAHG